jgi:hypothetical protein
LSLADSVTVTEPPTDAEQELGLQVNVVVGGVVSVGVDAPAFSARIAPPLPPSVPDSVHDGCELPVAVVSANAARPCTVVEYEKSAIAVNELEPSVDVTLLG